jgi:hypothetical protein
MKLPPEYFDAAAVAFTGRGCMQLCKDDLAKRRCPSVPIWTVDCGLGGYLSCGLAVMARRIELLQPPGRRFYEVVQPGRLCKLFFDLDCKDLAFASELPAFEQALSDAVAAEGAAWHFAVAATVAIVSDATTATKLSRHYLFPAYVFETVDVGTGRGMRVFAQGVKQRLLEKWPRMQEWLDSGVYTPNRNWRLTFCTKKGKGNNLRIVSPPSLAAAPFIVQLIKSMVTTCILPDACVPEAWAEVGSHMLIVHDIVTRPPQDARESRGPKRRRGGGKGAAKCAVPPELVAVAARVERDVVRVLHPLGASSALRVDRQFDDDQFVFFVNPSFPCAGKLVDDMPASHASNSSCFRCTMPSKEGTVVVTVWCCDPECKEKGVHKSGPATFRMI